MSSTNRGYKRHKTDYYVTPKKAIKEFLNSWLLDLQEAGEWIGDAPDKAYWLDPCAGGDGKHGMSYVEVLQEEFDPTFLDSIDIREDSKAETKADYLTWDKKLNEHHVIITNPPFYLAQEIITKALKDVCDGGFVCMLLRLNFFGSIQRFNFFENNMPRWCYVHHRRMSFTDDGQTDSIEYMHAIWQKGCKQNYTTLRII